MKRIMLFLSVVLLISATCRKRCEIDKPQDLKPIDWENYNDVYTVYWNLFSYNSHTIPVGKTIKISGWIAVGYNAYFSINNFYLAQDSIAEVDNSNKFYIRILSNLIENELQEKFDSLNVTQKCYIQGELQKCGIPHTWCWHYFPEILIKDVDDIYFEGERSKK